MAGSGAILVDGAPATAEALSHLALVNYGAYTSMRVEGGGVRGLDLHLERLEASAVELFGEAVGEARLRDFMRGAVAGQADCWLRVGLFSPEIGPRNPAWIGRPKVTTAVFPPPPPLGDALRLELRAYSREEPRLKHAATFGLIRARRAARGAGYDDALFVDADGFVSEGSLWNIGFLEGETVVWPRAPMLAGTAQAVLQRGLSDVGLTGVVEPVRVTDLDRFDGAFICNSATSAGAVASIGERVLATSPAIIQRLRAAWDAAPLQPI